MSGEVPKLMPVEADHRLELENVTPRLGYDGGDFCQWQRRARAELAKLVGVRPVDNVAVRIEDVWTRPHQHGTVRKLLLHAEGIGTVIMYWCLPAEMKCEPVPAMICLQGHSPGMHVSLGLEADECMPAEVNGDRDFASQCLRHGIAALCVEQRGFGQRRDWDKTTTDCQFMTMRAMMLGRTLVAERVMDVQIALRWLQQRPEVDAQRIGIMGNSGGGTATFYTAALTDGVHLAVPSCSFGRLRDTWFDTRRCACGYVPGILHLMDLPDVLALHAPKPVVVVGGEHDKLCLGPAVRRAFDDLKQRYEAAGAGDACQLVIGPEGHRFYADLAWPKMLQWL